jgi:8-oxo-dGTP pyrophosphatase MutT (NUDIX family)
LKASEFQRFGSSAGDLKLRITDALTLPSYSALETGSLDRASAVVFLLAWHSGGGPGTGGPQLLLTKRSMHVRQPGDLCCPGGGITDPLDRRLAPLLRLPLSPLYAWRHRCNPDGGTQKLRLLLAAGLREAFEEIRLYPCGTRFLGALPPEHLVLFDRTIYPLVLWVRRQQRFFPNREVERLVAIPLADFFAEDRYGRFQLTMDGIADDRLDDFPCFVHSPGGEEELLWGATYRITMTFLERVFGFCPPRADQRPRIQRTFSGRYFSGAALEKK